MKTTMFLFFIGVVDFINNDILTAEITTSAQTIETVTFPVQVFPCELKEGDMFYFVHVDGVTEIRCGEPPE